MTWKDLKRFISDNNYNNEEKEEEIKLQSERFRIFKDLPFWISSIEEHKKEDIRTKGACCFNHTIGLPRKANSTELPIFDYESQIVDALDRYRDIWIKKARGLGITELLLRYISWLCVKDSAYTNCRFMIVTGPSLEGLKFVNDNS